LFDIKSANPNGIGCSPVFNQFEQQGPVETRLEGNYVVERRLFLKQLVNENRPISFLDWTHLQTMVRLEVTRSDEGTNDVTVENYEYITSLAPAALTSSRWIELLRRRWSVEKENHNMWDRILREDTRPWNLAPAGMINIIVLRRASIISSVFIGR